MENQLSQFILTLPFCSSRTLTKDNKNHNHSMVCHCVYILTRWYLMYRQGKDLENYILVHIPYVMCVCTGQNLFTIHKSYHIITRATLGRSVSTLRCGGGHNKHTHAEPYSNIILLVCRMNSAWNRRRGSDVVCLCVSWNIVVRLPLLLLLLLLHLYSMRVNKRVLCCSKNNYKSLIVFTGWLWVVVRRSMGYEVVSLLRDSGNDDDEKWRDDDGGKWLKPWFW